MRSRVRGRPIKDDNWVVFTATRFRTAEQAARFGLALQTAMSVSCAMRNVPIDVGAENSPTSQWADSVKAAVEAKTGSFLTDDVHGLDVYPDTTTSFALVLEATLTVHTPPELLLVPADELGSRISQLSESTRLASYLLNAAAISSHPVATATLCISAVELLAQKQKRNTAQKAWIKSVRASLEADGSMSAADKADLMKAANTMFNVGISDRVKKMMTGLGLEDELDRWDSLYAARSQLFHGLRHFTQSEIQSLGSDASDLCRLILRRSVIAEVGPVSF